MMRDGVMLDQKRITAMTKAGLWHGKLTIDDFDASLAAHPDRAAVIDHNSTTGTSTTLSYQELDVLSRRIGLGLVGHGINRGDVVAFQMPNIWEFVAIFLACQRIGALSNPLMPIFRHRELRFMLDFGEAKALFIPASFRNFDYPAMISDIRAELPLLEHVFVIGDGFEAALVERHWEDELTGETTFAERRLDPNEPCLLLYTSGTTGQPKGVLHTGKTLGTMPRSCAECVGLGAGEIALMASPLAHLTGFAYGMLTPILLGGTAVLQDIWSPGEAARLIERHGVTYTMGSTPFLSDLANYDGLGEHDLSSIHAFLSAGAPIPRVIARRVAERLGVNVFSGWGMTENGFATGTRPGDPEEKVFDTDGRPVTGIETRIVDTDGAPLPPDTEGRLQVRGAGQFVGYYKKPELYDTDAQGWFETGDLARMDADGYIRITGRSKDVIIRGGENIPVVEVEELLYRHDAVTAAAIVSMPDERMGERACAYLTVQPVRDLSFEDLVAYLLDAGLSKTYLPERLELVDEMPRTASGKIQKFELREMLMRKLQGENAP